VSDDLFTTLPSGIRICYRIDGAANGRPLVLIAGLGLDLTSWPKPFVDGLVRAGFRVIRLDNRDVGQSTHVATPPPSRRRQLTAKSAAEDYDLGDMAEDVVGLLDALHLGRVDLVGMSLGGMIAQTIAARNPTRVRSLTSIFSTTGDRRVGQPATSTILRMARRGPRTREEYGQRHVATMRRIGSKTFAPDDVLELEWALSSWERGGGRARGAGVARQIGAIFKSGDRTGELRNISAPTLIIHGDKDVMVNPTGGAATARAISGSVHHTIAGMGHHIAPDLVPQLLTMIVEHTSIDQKPGVDA